MAQDLKEMDYNAFLEGYTKQPGDRKDRCCVPTTWHPFTKPCLSFSRSFSQNLPIS